MFNTKSGLGPGQSVPSDASVRQQIRSQRRSPQPDGGSNDSLDNRGDDYNITARLSHLLKVNASGVSFGSNNRVLELYASPWAGDGQYPEAEMDIYGGTFIGGNVNTVHRSGEAGINILHRAVAFEAMHDSADAYPQPRYHPEKREEMLDNSWNWATKSVWNPDGNLQRP
ncbi:hypothetical protein C8J57DRAFT_758633 [Mycena rebaudengoi]|nr:hypothetical protein C8J57DRAFT_758633 [Mycena rebaudengoi]